MGTMQRWIVATMFALIFVPVARADSTLPPSGPDGVQACIARLERARVELGRKDPEFARGKIVPTATGEGNVAFALEAPRDNSAARPPLFEIQLSRQQDTLYDEPEVEHLAPHLWESGRTNRNAGRPFHVAGRHVYQHPRGLGWTIYLCVYFGANQARFERFRDQFARAAEDCVSVLNQH